MDRPVRFIRSMRPPRMVFGFTRFLLYIDHMPKGTFRLFIYADNTTAYDCTSKDLDDQSFQLNPSLT